MNKKEYPLIQLQSIELMLKKLRELVSIHSDIVELVGSKNLIRIKDMDLKSNFFFRVYDSKLETTQKVNFNFEYLPKNSVLSQDAENKIDDLDGVVRSFNKWVSLIQNYNKINLTQEDEYINFYEKELYDEFVILDIDANNIPFDYLRQEGLYKYLTIIENKLIESNVGHDSLDDLIEESQDLKRDISRITKNKTIKRLSRLMAKVKVKAVDVFYFVLDVGKKEAVKSLLNGGFDKFKSILNVLN